MGSDERSEWARAVLEANRLGHIGTRVVAVNVLLPTAATEMPAVVFQIDNGPTSATENW